MADTRNGMELKVLTHEAVSRSSKSPTLREDHSLDEDQFKIKPALYRNRSTSMGSEDEKDAFKLTAVDDAREFEDDSTSMFQFSVDAPLQVSVSVEKEPAKSKNIQTESKRQVIKNKAFKPTEKVIWSIVPLSSGGTEMKCFSELEPNQDEKSHDSNEGGFEIFGITRAEGIKILLQYAKDESKEEDTELVKKNKNIRHIAAPEIRQAFLEDKLPERMRNDAY